MRTGWVELDVALYGGPAVHDRSSYDIPDAARDLSNRDLLLFMVRMAHDRREAGGRVATTRELLMTRLRADWKAAVARNGNPYKFDFRHDGATTALGFKGIGGNFVRHGLMEFEADITSSAKFKRLDNGQSVEVVYDPSGVEGHPSQQELMQKIMQGTATPEEKGSFGGIWQQRVEKIFNNIDKVITIKS